MSLCDASKFDKASSDLRRNVCVWRHVRQLAVTESVLSEYTRGSARTMGRLREQHPVRYVEHEDGRARARA